MLGPFAPCRSVVVVVVVSGGGGELMSQWGVMLVVLLSRLA